MTAFTSHSDCAQSQHSTVVIADDDPIMLAQASTLLRGAGWNVKPVRNGLDALKLVETCRVDAIILDMRMPELDGYEVCLNLLRRGIKIPTLVITGGIGDSEPLGYLNVSRTLNKPVNPSDLLDFVNGATIAA